MTQDSDALDSLVRKRIRALRSAHGWSLDDLAARCHLSPSTLSRIETGHRRIALDQLTAIARALGTSLDQLVETADDDVVSNPSHHAARGLTQWTLREDPGVTVARMRLTDPPPDGPAALKAHPGREWFTVLSGTVVLLLGERRLRVEQGQAAEFPTMVPHAVGAVGGPAEIIGIFDREGRRTHLPGRTSDRGAPAGPAAHRPGPASA
ncbi:helix-turn-helix domain-containing protein [Kitasatospora sp. NPDC057223]|uniref:helix-turn-helix domain-containing protein n=1 Tax=Kitasatospora sp. NPDC057223 TaxID=3346055 RepID=UPI0036358EBF